MYKRGVRGRVPPLEFTVCSLFVLISVAATGANAVHAQARAGDVEQRVSSGPLEEVTVRGRRSLAAYRLERDAARERVMDVFNEINSRDEFDISCRRESRRGSRIPKRVCRARFSDDVANEAANAYVAALKSICPFGIDQTCIFSDRAQPGMSSAQAVESEEHYKRLLLNEEIRRLAQENGKLRQAMQEYAERERAYREARARLGE